MSYNSSRTDRVDRYEMMAVNGTTQMEEALALALRLPLSDRLRLVERVVASVEQDITSAPPASEPGSEEHWGKHLVQLVEELDFTGWSYIDVDDPVEWVRRVRQDQAARRGLDWRSDE
jgi:hypothetical protein